MKNSRIEVLLIEGDLAEADLMREMLAESRGWEFSVEHVRHLADGLDLLKNRSFDCVLVDLGLPDSQGLETALAVRNQAKQTPIGIVTSRDDEELALKALQLDIQDYLIKGEITGNLLARSIRYAIQRKRSSEDLRLTEEALGESEEKFSKIFDTAPVGMTISSLVDGRFVDINREGERLSGYRRDEVIGRTTLEFDIWKDPDERGRMIEEVQGEGLVRDREMTFRDKEGNVQLGLFSSAVISIGGKKHLLSIVSDTTERKRTEAEMQRLASFPLMKPNPILEVDTAGRLTFCNPAAKEILEKTGYGDDANPFIPEDFPAVFKNLLDEKAHRVFREVAVDGRYFEELIFLTPHMKTARIYTMDITRRKQVEQERERLLLQLEAILNSINEGVAVSDLEGHVSIMNREALALHEIENIEEVRRPLIEYWEMFELFDLDGRLVQFEDWPLPRALRGERFVDYEVRVHRKDTGRVWIASYSGSPVHNNAGETILAVITVRDVTERKRMEQALQDSEVHYRTLFDSIDEGFCIIEMIFNETDNPIDYRFLETNPSFEKQTGVVNAKGKRIRELAPKHEEHWFEIYGRVALTGEPARFQKRAEQLGRWYDVYAFRFGRPEDRQVAILFNDITERRRAEEEIKRLNADLAARAAELEIANRELEAFNYTVAHDLRKPLTVVNGYCQALGELCGSKLDEACNGYLREAYEGTLRMNRLIDALLNFSRLAHVEPRRESVDLSAMAHLVAAELKLAEPERRVGFQIADGVSVDGDAALLRIVLDNLLGNAWKYTSTREEAVIEFGMTEIDGHPACFIRDNGAGFDMEYAEKLFIPFQRLPGAEECKGFGIGLATVERIIRRHGGKIWAEGEPDKGATFWFTLQS